MKLEHSRVLLGLLVAGSVSGGASAGELRLGAAAVKITPPVGLPLAGYYSPRGSDGVLDDLYAKALVLNDGRTAAAMVVCDLIMLPQETVVAARKLVAAQTSIPEDAVMLSATHTHTGPILVRGSVRDDIGGPPSEAVKKYTADLPGLIARAVAEAHQSLKPVRVSYARGHEERLSFNRRYWMKDGSVGWNPGKHNPNVIRPVGPTDPEIGVVYFETPDAQPVLTYVNFAMHPDTTGGLKYWPDYPGVLAHRLAEYKGPGMLTVFANGACGNLNHVNVEWSDRQHGPEEAIRLGTILAGDVLKSYMDLKPAGELTLAARRQVVELPLPPVSEADVAAAREIVAQGPKAKFLEQVQAYKVLDVAQRQGRPWETEVQVIALGRELAWVALPGEVFVELGLNVKQASRFAQTHVVELANGFSSYVPNCSAYPEGNYEPTSTRCAVGSGERLVAAAIRLLDELAPDTTGVKHEVIEPPH